MEAMSPQQDHLGQGRSSSLAGGSRLAAVSDGKKVSASGVLCAPSLGWTSLPPSLSRAIPPPPPLLPTAVSSVPAPRVQRAPRPFTREYICPCRGGLLAPEEARSKDGDWGVRR